MRTLTSKRLATWFLTPVLLLTLLSGMGALAAEDDAPSPPAVETTTEPTGEEQPAPEVRKAPQRAAGDKYGYASFQFRQSDVKAIQLHSGEYINECVGGTVPTVWQSTTEYPDIYDFIRDGDYKALHYHGFLYLKGDLDLHGANINVDMMKLGFGISPKIYVKENASLYNSDSLIYSYDTGVEIFIPTGKKLELNAVFPGRQKYPGAIRVAGEVTITGGGRLDILYTLINTESGTTPRALFGIYGGEGVTLRGNKDDGTGPTVNIKMDSGAFGPEANDVVGIWSGGDLIIQDDSKVKIEMLGHRLGQTDTKADVNWAIHAKRLELLNNASLEILSHKNVIHDIVLTAESGDVLKVDTTGFLNIRNKGNIQRYDEGTWQHLKNDYPKSNIHLFKGNAQGARANIIRAEQGVKIESFSAQIDDWYKKLNDPEQGNWNWAISGTDGDPVLGTNMYRGNRRIGNLVQVDSTTTIYTWGSIEYIYEPQGVVTVQKSNGLIMGWHAPEGNPQGSSLYYAKVLEPNFNDIHILRKGESIELTTTGTKGTFLYWYDALNPEGSGSGTSWKNLTQKFTNIQRDMVLVPVYDPMTAGPTLSDVGYSVQWDKGVTKQTRYAYQDMTFKKANDIITTGGYRVMLVPAQLPAYGEKTYAVDDLDGSPLMNLRSARLYADKNAFGGTDELGNWHFNIPPGRYRIACMDDDSNYCFISKPFTFDPPLAPPYISPITKIYDAHDGGVKTVTITAERGAPIKYCLWDYDKNKWGKLNDYSGPFEVEVTAAQDVRIEAYAGPIIKEITSEVRYALQPTGKPTVKHGDTVVSDGIGRYFYGSIDLTVEAPEGYEVWYRVDEQPSESNMGTKVENGKVTITDSGSNEILYFKLAKAFTMDGVTYRKLGQKSTSVHLTKLETLPAPRVTVKTKEGGTTLIPDGSNTYTIREFVNVELTGTGSMPLNATMAYDRHGGATPNGATAYTTPFEVRGDSTVSVFTCVPNADGGYDYKGESYVFKVDPSVKKVLLVVRYATAYDSDGNELLNASTSGVNVSVGARIRVVPIVPTGKVFKNWSADGIYDTPSDKFKEELFFTVPDRSNNYNQLILDAEFADESEAYITGDTKVLLAMGSTQYNGNDVIMQGTVGDSVDLFTDQGAGVDYHALRTITYQWWEGDTVGEDEDALPEWATFDKSKTYTVKVTITANEGVTFANTAGVQFGIYGKFFKMKDVTHSSDGKTLTFTATPLREMNLTLPTLHDGDNLSGIEKSMNGQLMPLGYITGVWWESGTPNYATTATTGTYYIEKLLLKPYSSSTVNRPLLDNKVVIDGTWYYHESDENGNYVVVNYTSPGQRRIPIRVLPKGVSVSGQVTSYNPNNPTTVRLLQNGTEMYQTTIAVASGSGPVTQDFTFETVAEGTYDLVVTKPGHLSYTVKNVVVGSAPLDLTAQTGKPYQTITLLAGDVNGDGLIDVGDLSTVWNGANYNKSVAAASDKAADLNGDGLVDVGDLNIVWNAANYNKKADTHCVVSY